MSSTQQKTTIWVDADGCPQAVKEILLRAAERTGVPMVMVANRLIHTPARIANVRSLVVPPGFDAADHRIVTEARKGDLAGIRQRLVMRDLMDTLRASGIQSGGPAAYRQQDKQKFGNALDRVLVRFRAES